MTQVHIKASMNNAYENMQSALLQNGWIYSTDGQNVRTATGFWEKFNAIIKLIVNPRMFGNLREKAILNLFDERVGKFISEIKKIDDDDTEDLCSMDSEWLIYPFDVIDRSEECQQAFKNIDFSSLENLSLFTLKDEYASDSTFRSALIAYKYFKDLSLRKE